MYVVLVQHGQIQDFLKEGAPKLRTDKSSVTVGTRGVWGERAPSEAEKNVIFGVNSHDLVHYFLEAPTQNQAHYLWKK